MNESYLKVVRQGPVAWRNRAHFYTIVSMIMRRILVDHARKRHAEKRGGGWQRVPLDQACQALEGDRASLVDIDRALKKLSVTDPELARVVNLRVFGGFSVEETAKILGCSRATLGRRWRLAKDSLADALGRRQTD